MRASLFCEHMTIRSYSFLGKHTTTQTILPITLSNTSCDDNILSGGRGRRFNYDWFKALTVSADWLAVLAMRADWLQALIVREVGAD